MLFNSGLKELYFEGNAPAPKIINYNSCSWRYRGKNKLFWRKTSKKSISNNRENYGICQQAFDCANDAEKATDKLIKKCRYHNVLQKIITEKKIYEESGRRSPKEKR